MSYTLTDLLPLFLALFLKSIKPGPYMLAFVSMAAGGRWKSMIVFWVGHMLAGTCLYFLTLSALNFAGLELNAFMALIKALAGTLLVHIGLMSWQNDTHNAYEAGVEKAEQINAASIAKNLTSSFSLAFSNPLDVVFLFTVLPAIMNTTAFSLTDITVLRSIAISSNLIVVCGYCLPILLLRKHIPQRLLGPMKQFSSIALMLIGLYLLISTFIEWVTAI